MEPFITTFTGRTVNPLNLNLQDIDIRDIAHALALCNRFAGHSRVPISVAQHSCWVSHLCNGTPYMKQGLLHDASEAYLGDMTKWLKESPGMEAYRVAEEQALRVILDKFGCSGPYGDGLRSEYSDSLLSVFVEEQDRLMVRWEYEQAYGHGLPVEGYGALTVGERRRVNGWKPWSWERSEHEFLARFMDLNRR